MEPTGQRAYRPRKDEATDSPAQRQLQVGAPKSNFLLYQFAKPILPMELAAKAVMHLLKRQLPA